MKRSIALFSLALLVAAPALAGSEYDKEVVRQFEPGSVSALKLENLAGRILIEPSGGDELELRARVHANGHDGMEAREVAQLLDLEIVRDGEMILVRAKYPLKHYSRIHYAAADGGLFTGNTTIRMNRQKVKITTGRKGSGLPLWVDFQVRVPKGLDCALKHYVGQVKLEDLEGDYNLDCASANISVQKLKGDLLVDSGSGDIRVEKLEGAMNLDTGSGDIKVSALNGDFHADTGSGDIMLRDATGDRFHADTGSGDVVVKDTDYPQLGIDTGSGDVKVSALTTTPERWKVDTGSGDVIFVLPSSGASFRLEVDTSSGEVDCQLATSDVNMQRGKIRALTVGRGKGVIQVDTGSGDVSIVARED